MAFCLKLTQSKERVLVHGWDRLSTLQGREPQQQWSACAVVALVAIPVTKGRFVKGFSLSNSTNFPSLHIISFNSFRFFRKS